MPFKRLEIGSLLGKNFPVTGKPTGIVGGLNLPDLSIQGNGNLPTPANGGGIVNSNTVGTTSGGTSSNPVKGNDFDEFLKKWGIWIAAALAGFVLLK